VIDGRGYLDWLSRAVQLLYTVNDDDDSNDVMNKCWQAAQAAAQITQLYAQISIKYQMPYLLFTLYHLM